MNARSILLLALTGSLPGACTAPTRVNPSFSVSSPQAASALQAMRADPKPLNRPLVILGGFNDPIGAALCRGRFASVLADRRVITVSFIGCTSFEQCRQRVIQAVDQAFPCDDATMTSEVDVIGLSMGGLVARVSAEPADEPQGQRRLRIARLFAVSSPLRGARLAEFPLVLTSMHRDLREGSELLRRLNEDPPHYAIYCYTRLRDHTVGEEFCAPTGRDPWWLDSPPLVPAHFAAARDKRILADIARRLRGEQPFASEPPAPLPDDPRHRGG